MKIYYLIQDGKMTDVFEPVYSEEEESALLEKLASQCDDRTNYGCFKGFEFRTLFFAKKISEAILKETNRLDAIAEKILDVKQ